MSAGPTVADYLDAVRYRRYSRSVLLERRRLLGHALVCGGDAWLADDTGTNDNNQPCDNRVERVVERAKGGQPRPVSANGPDSGEILSASDNNVDTTESGPEEEPPGSALCSSGIVERVKSETAASAADGGSEGDSALDARSTARSTCLFLVEHVERGTDDPHDFFALDGPTFEPCSACGKTPSFFREKWWKGLTERRRLCRRCYDTAVRRAQAAVEPLPRVIASAAMERVTASVGRCGLCGLERAAWKGRGSGSARRATSGSRGGRWRPESRPWGKERTTQTPHRIRAPPRLRSTRTGMGWISMMSEQP